MTTISQAKADADLQEARAQIRQMFGSAALRTLDQLSAMTPAERERAFDAVCQTRGSVSAIGSWPNLTVIVDGERFNVRPGADRILIETGSDKAWARIMAADVGNLLAALRTTHFGDQSILHALQASGRTTLASLVMEAVIESKTARAMVGISSYAHSGGAG